MENSNMKVLIMVVNAGFAEEVVEKARTKGLRGATILNSRGEGVQHESFMGITLDTEKELILSVTDEATANAIMAIMKEKAGVGTSAHCICCTMPVEKTVGLLPND